MTKIPVIPEQPTLMDHILQEFQTKLQKHLPWLDYACGRVTEHEHDGRMLPKIYIGSGNYAEVMPDASLGNYCFFDVDPNREVLEHMKGRAMLIKSKFGLVIWFNLESIYPGSKERRTESLVDDVIRALVCKISLSKAGFLITRITDNAKQVFGKYAGRNPESKYMMHPYGAFRFEGELIYNTGVI
jgi:hypothetical protein